MPPDDHDDNFKSSDNVVAFPSKDDLAEIERLAALDSLQYDRERADAAHRLDVRKSTLDERVAAKRAERPKRALPVFGIDALAKSAKHIIASEDVLDLFAIEWRKLVAGEERNAKLLYLVATSRIFPKAMHAAIKGPSSGGKSEIRKQILEFFPSESVISFTSLSEKALIYFEGDFDHKILSMGEATGADEQSFQDYLLRELMSEGVLRYQTVQKVGAEMQTIQIVKHGPVSFLVTTTKTLLHPENETRLLSLDIDDSEEQTRAVLSKVSAIEGMNDVGARVDFGPWQDFQRWLEGGEHKVIVPYAKSLAAAVPPRSVRLRRDLGQVLRAIKAHALLHRNHRERGDHGVIVADIDRDYAAIRDLMHGLLQETAEVAIKKTVVQTIEAVNKLTEDMPKEQGTTAKAVGKELKLDRSAARRRLLAGQDEGFIINLEEKRGRPGRYRTTDETREEEVMLPTVEGLKTLFSPTPPKSLPPCHQEQLGHTDQRDNGGKSGGKTVGNLNADATGGTVVAQGLPPVLPPVKPCNTEENGQWWHGGTKSEGVAEEKKKNEAEESDPAAEPDDPSTYLDDSDSPLSPETREANRFLDPDPIPPEFDRLGSGMTPEST